MSFPMFLCKDSYRALSITHNLAAKCPSKKEDKLVTALAFFKLETMAKTNRT
jgi:hypothetical protein